MGELWSEKEVMWLRELIRSADGALVLPLSGVSHLKDNNWIDFLIKIMLNISGLIVSEFRRNINVFGIFNTMPRSEIGRLKPCQI